MLSFDDGFFIETLTDSSSRILHPAKVLGTKDGAIIARIEETGVSVEPGAECLIYYELKNKFVKQSARIESAFEDEIGPVVEFVTVGEPMSAESRQHYRVSTVMSDLTAGLGPDRHGKLLNVSAIGFSVLSAVKHNVGTTLQASVSFEGRNYSGKVCIQSIRPMDNDLIRYGAHCVDTNGSDGNLEKGLREITMAIQRKQLRRLARAT